MGTGTVQMPNSERQPPSKV